MEQIHQMLLTGFLKTSYIEIKDTQRITHQILQNDIIYFTSSAPHILTIVTKDATLKTRTYTIEGLLKRLGPPFIRCHKQFVINKNHIDNLCKRFNDIEISGHHIPIGKTYLNHF